MIKWLSVENYPFYQSFFLTSNIKQKLSGIYFRAVWNRLLLPLSNFLLKNHLGFSSSLNIALPPFKLCELNLLILPPHFIPCRPFTTCAMDAALFQVILKVHNFNFFKSEQNTGMADIISKIRSKLSFHKWMLQTETFSSLHSSKQVPLEHRKKLLHKVFSSSNTLLFQIYSPARHAKQHAQNSID